ncbi:MAG: hypothetical protein J7J30_04925 [Candidatus Odinarchaeota archaeon]|nr:hypothetical protein [Candidatus Odinarchaeota archaeon]
MKKTLIIGSLAILVMFICINLLSTSEVHGQEITTAYRGQTIILSAVLNDDLGNPVPNETIYFYDETHDIYLGYAVTDENGNAKILWSIPKNYTLGPITLNATFQGDPEKNLKPSYQVFQLVLKSKTYISAIVADATLDPNDYVVAPGDEVIVNVTVVDDIGQPVGVINVSLIEERGKIVDQEYTNENGETVLKYQLPEKISTNQIKLLIQASPYQYYEKSECSITLYIKKIRTDMTILRVEPNTVYRNQSVTILGKLVDEEENPLINAAIYVKAGERNISLTWTNTSGFFEATFHVANSIKPGKYVYTVLFIGSPRYEYVEENVTLIVKSNATICFNLKNATVIYGQIARVNVTLVDDYDQPIPSKKLTVFDDQNNLLTTVLTDENGHATIQWFVYQKRGCKNITVVFSGDEFYNPTMLRIPLIVFERPLLIIEKENNITLVTRNMQISVLIHLSSLESRPLQNQFVCIYDVINHMCIGNVTTDQFGKAKFIYTVPSNAAFGQLIIKVVYFGNLEKYFLRVEKYIVYTVVEKIPTKLTLNVSKQVKAGEIVTGEIKLQTIEGKSIGYEKVIIYLNNSLLAILETNKYGRALVKFEAPSDASIIVVSLKYNGSEFYMASEYSVQIKIITPRSVIFFLENKDVLKFFCTFCLLGIFIVIRRWKSSSETIII